MEKMNILFVFAVSCVVASWKVGHAHTVMVELVEFDNPSGEGSNGHCCDGKWGICQDHGCDHYFEICVTSQSDVDAGCSESGYTKTSVTKNQDHIEFTGDKAVTIFREESTVLSDYHLKVIVKDKDSVGDDDDVDTLVGSVHLAPLGVKQLFTVSARTELSATIWYSCDDNYYDCELCGDTGTPRCSVRCDATGTHGSCDSHGNLICEAGWTGDRCDEVVTTTTTTTAAPTTTTSATTPVPTGEVPIVTTGITDNGITYAQVDYGIYRYRAMYTEVAQEDMYELCSNVSLGSWPAILDDELVRIIGDGIVSAQLFWEFWVVGKSKLENHSPIASMEDTKSCGSRCVIISSWAEPGNPDSHMVGEHYTPFTKNCDLMVGVLCQSWVD